MESGKTVFLYMDKERNKRYSKISPNLTLNYIGGN